MDFFDSQDRARRRTGRMVVLFAAGVVALTIASTAIITACVAGSGSFHPVVPILAAVGTVAVILLGTAYKLAELRAGGRVVAEALGGRLVDPGTRDPAMRRLLNVVEEMAIASGVPVPPVYITDEPAVNAFAAGYGPDSAVIGVTRGCVDLLSRDELQGVMAHEFSHILNGDMRLNLRLIGVLHGILVIGLIGGALLRVGAYSGGGRRSNRDGNAAGAMLLIGIGLAVIGYAGTFIGNLIKASISRQREYLADASAVQFTRNPDGIAGALRKIGAIGSKLVSPRAAEASHMYFATGLRIFGSGLGLATHPPLDDRIRRIDPGWDGSWPVVSEIRRGAEPGAERGAEPGPERRAERGPDPRAPGFATGEPAERVPRAVTSTPAIGAGLALIGDPRPEHVHWARELLSALPPSLVNAARDPHDARTLILGLVLDTDPDARRGQLAVVAADDSAAGRVLQGLLAAIDGAPIEARLPLVELALPALGELSKAQYLAFAGMVRRLVEFDGKVSVFEWLLLKVLDHALAPTFDPRRRDARAHDLRRLRGECADLLSLLAFAGARSTGAAESAFAAGAEVLGLSVAIRPPGSVTLARFDEVVDRLAGVAPRWQKVIIRACAATISRDAVITVEEAELFRGLALALRMPVPPIFAGMPTGATGEPV